MRPRVKRKAELIEELLYLPSPVRAHPYGRPHALTMGWLSNCGQQPLVLISVSNHHRSSRSGPMNLSLIFTWWVSQIGRDDQEVHQNLLSRIAASSASKSA